MKIDIYDVGETVICDSGTSKDCKRDYTALDDQGGFLFGSNGYCPPCAKEAYPRIVSYGEQEYIKAVCPEGMSFREFILKIRNGHNNVTVHSDLSLEEMFDVLGGKK